MGCNECTHLSCQHSLNSLGIGQCVECDSGVLVLDPTSGPKWRMACNKCNVVVHFFEHAHRVQVRKQPSFCVSVLQHSEIGCSCCCSCFSDLSPCCGEGAYYYLRRPASYIACVSQQQSSVSPDSYCISHSSSLSNLLVFRSDKLLP